MTESAPQVDPGRTAAVLHSLALGFVDKAEGRVEGEPGEFIDPLELYRQAAGFEQEAFRVCPYVRPDRRNELAVLGTNFALLGRNFSGAISFGTWALEDLGMTKIPSTERKIKRMIGEALVGLPESSVAQ